MTAIKRRSRVLGPLVVVALIIAACGGDSGDTTTTAGEATTTEADATTTAAAETTTSAAAETTTSAAASEAVEITAGDSITATFLPKCTNIAVFPQANSGAEEAAAELGSDPAEFVGPADCGDATGQIEFMTNAVTQGVQAIMLSNNSGDQLDAPAQAAADAGIPVVTWDSPIPSATGESVFVAQVDFDETGQVMAEMARTILGDDGGEFAILSAGPDSANQNAWIAAMEDVLATPEFENLGVGRDGLWQRRGRRLGDRCPGPGRSHPDLELIMAPTTVGIVAAAQAMTQEGLCETIKVSGLGLPEEMAPYVESGCAPEFALWSFVDLGYLAYYVAYGIAT